MRRIHKNLLSRGLGKKHGPKVLIHSFRRKASASLLPFDNLVMDRLEAAILQPFGRRAGEGQTTKPDTHQGYRSHDSILSSRAKGPGDSYSVEHSAVDLEAGPRDVAGGV